MTEKRYFALIGEDGYVYPVFFDSDNDDREIDVDTVVDLLNENEQLKGEVAHYKLILMSLEEQAKRISSIRSCRDD